MRFKFIAAVLATLSLPVAGLASADVTYEGNGFCIEAPETLTAKGFQPNANGKIFSFEDRGALRAGIFRGTGDRQAELEGWERETVILADQICSSYRPTPRFGLRGQRFVCEWNIDRSSQLLHIWLAEDAPLGMLESLRVCPSRHD